MCRYLSFLASFRRLLDCGQSDQAIELAESMVNQCPDFVVYREHWAHSLWDQERYGEVRRVLQQAQSLGLLSPYALLMLVHNWDVLQKPTHLSDTLIFAVVAKVGSAKFFTK